jgi:UDP-N-acetyl-D-glucosamine dehydrogenase
MRSTSTLRRRLLARDARVAVVGQGYVGLSLACAAAEAGFEVTGVDVDADRVDGLAAGRLVVPGVDEATFQAGVATGRLRFSADGDALATSDVICICVPTPVRDHTPDLSYVEQACRDVARHLVGGRLVVLESSTYPGTTNDLVTPLL